MRSALPYLLAGLLAFLLFSVAHLPASVVVDRLDPDHGWLGGPLSGTAWSGRAALAPGGRQLGRLRWQLAPSALLKGRLQLRGRLEGPGATATLVVQRALWADAWSAADGQLQLPVGPLASLLQLPVELEGSLLGSIERLELAVDGTPRLTAAIDWQQARLAFGRRWDLGRVSLHSEPMATGSRITVRGQGGELRLDGELMLTAQGYRIELELLPQTPAARTALRDYGASGPKARLQLVRQGDW